jgi:hypothetical protein
MRRAVAKTLGALLAAAAGIILALHGAGVVDAPARLLVACIVTSAALAAVATIGSAWREWRERRLGQRHELAEITLTTAIWTVVDQVDPPLDYRDLGVAGYRIEAVWWWPWRSRLRRVHRVRASRRPVSSDVAWRPGKGVIGACVDRGEVVAVDLAQLYADLGDPTAEEWRDLPADLRLGLDYEEYRDVRDKYAVVVATPIIDDSGPRSRVVGCVVLDGPAGRLADLTTDEVLGLLNFAAQALLQQVARGVGS